MINNEELIIAATSAGFDKVLTSKGTQKVQGCMKCRKNTALEFINKDGYRLAACVCGYRKGFSKARPKKEADPYPGRCQALTKKGERCKNKAHKGSCYCGHHKEARQGEHK